MWLCNRVFGNYRETERHIATHYGDNNYICGFCGIRCNLLTNMKKHVPEDSWRMRGRQRAKNEVDSGTTKISSVQYYSSNGLRGPRGLSSLIARPVESRMREKVDFWNLQVTIALFLRPLSHTMQGDTCPTELHVYISNGHSSNTSRIQDVS